MLRVLPSGTGAPAQNLPLTRAPLPIAFQDTDVRAVDGSPLLRQQLRRQNLGQERMREPVASVRPQHENARVDCLPQQRDQ